MTRKTKRREVPLSPAQQKALRNIRDYGNACHGLTGRKAQDMMQSTVAIHRKGWVKNGKLTEKGKDALRKRKW